MTTNSDVGTTLAHPSPVAFKDSVSDRGPQQSRDLSLQQGVQSYS